MVKRPPYQKRGKCGHFMPQFDSHGSCFGCRTKCKGQDPCAQRADTMQCSACASLTEEQFTIGPVQQSMTDSSALFRALHPLSQRVTQDIPPPGYAPHTTPCRQSVVERMAALSFPQPQRDVSTTEIPQTPRTQLISSQLEQQNFEMMNTLQQNNQQQIKDLSAQLQTGLQAFLQQSMEQMFNRLVPAQTQPPAATSTTPPPHIVSILCQVGEQGAPTTSLSGNWSKRLGSSCPFLTQQQNRTTSWAQHYDMIPFSYSRKSWIDAPSIKLPMVADLSRLQTAQDDSVKPSTSNTLEIGKFPGIPPHKGSWYSVVDNIFSQTPQVVPQASQTLQNLATGVDPSFSPTEGLSQAGIHDLREHQHC